MPSPQIVAPSSPSDDCPEGGHIGAIKVFGVGWHKTGTTSLHRALERLGSARHRGCDPHAFRLLRHGHPAAVLDYAEWFTSFDDWPWPFLYREAYDRWPGARFVLTTRADEDTWYRSLAAHVPRRRGQNPNGYRYERYIYGTEDVATVEDYARRLYREHNEAVRTFFADKPGALLEICWERGDGWAELCGFLGAPVPDEPFPHANAAPSPPIRRGLAQQVRRLTRRFWHR